MQAECVKKGLSVRIVYSSHCSDNDNKSFIWPIGRREMPLKISRTWLLGRIIYIAVQNITIMGKNTVCGIVRCL